MNELRETLSTLWPGDHLRVSTRPGHQSDFMYDKHYMDEQSWWIRGYSNEGMVVLGLPDPPESAKTYYPPVAALTVELVAKPELFTTGRPRYGDWFYLWYTLPEPCAYIFWRLKGPCPDGTYTMYELSPHEFTRGNSRVKLERKLGWTNYVTFEDGVLCDRTNGPVQFFKPPFLPRFMRVPSLQMSFL